MTPLSLPGVLTARELRATAEHIAAQQCPSGLIPWFPGHHGDPWDHVEGAMALAVCGLQDESRAAYEWSAATQAPDGTWPMETVWGDDGERVTDASADTNQCAYIAVGVSKENALTRAYHKVLVWDMMSAPKVTRLSERALNPVLGKSVVLYFRKP